MRIAIDCRKIADFGIGTYIRGLLEGISRSDTDHQIVLFVPSELASLVPSDRRFVTVPFSSPLYSVRELFSLASAARSQRIDLLHNPHYVTPFSSIPMVTTIHDLIHLHQPAGNPLARVYADRMIRRALKKSRWVATVSAAVREQLIELQPESAAKVRAIPNGVNATFFDRRGREQIQETASRLGIGNSRYFLFVGNDKPHKNLRRVISAFEAVAANDAGVRLVLAGAAPPAAARPEVQSVGMLSDEDLIRLYQGSEALVFPSLEEGFGLPALEAMASGTPVITSHDPALVELTEEAAIHVDAKDTGAISSAMQRLLSDPSLRAKLVNQGRQRALGYSWDRCAAATLDLYEQIP